jgi:hypothetical protein
MVIENAYVEIHPGDVVEHVVFKRCRIVASATLRASKARTDLRAGEARLGVGVVFVDCNITTTPGVAVLVDARERLAS